MVEIRFLEKNEKWYKIHDWEQHQPWIYHSEVRSEQAKNAARARWNAVSMQDACAEHAERNAPSPIPTPIPVYINAFVEKIINILPSPFTFLGI